MALNSRDEQARPAVPSRRALIAGAATLVVTLACIGVITLTPAAESAPLPFWCVRCGARAGVDFLLNVLMFTPIGAGLALLRVRTRWAMLFIIGTTIIIETLQYGMIDGRFASARDIVANSLGGIAAWQLVRARRSIAFPSPGHAFVLGQAAALTWIVTQLFTAWTMHVVAPPGPWWAQIKLHDLGFPSQFRGDLVRASLGISPIAHSDQLEETEIVRSQLIGGRAMTVVVTNADATAGAAPILMLAAHDRLSEVAALAQTGRAAFFRVRMRAAAIGLRNPSIRLEEVFPAGSAADTIALSGEYSAGRYRIATVHAGHRRERTLAASPSWTWALLMPIPHYSFGPEVRWLTALWLLAAVALAGFWTGQGSASFAGRTPADARIRSIAPLAIAIVIGLGVVPVAFDLPVSHWSEWIAAGAGAVCGWLAGLRLRRRRIPETRVAAGTA